MALDRAAIVACHRRYGCVVLAATAGGWGINPVSSDSSQVARVHWCQRRVRLSTGGVFIFGFNSHRRGLFLVLEGQQRNGAGSILLYSFGLFCAFLHSLSHFLCLLSLEEGGGNKAKEMTIFFFI